MKISSSMQYCLCAAGYLDFFILAAKPFPLERMEKQEQQLLGQQQHSPEEKL
jgi:hypothetical protein